MFTAEYLNSLFNDIENKECEFEIKTNIPKAMNMGTDFVTFKSMIQKGKDGCRMSEVTIVEVVKITDDGLMLRKEFTKVMCEISEPKGYTTTNVVTLHHIPLDCIVDVMFIEQEESTFSKTL